MLPTDKRKRANISSKHQVTIPQVFYNALGFGDEAEFYILNGHLVIDPVHRTASGEADIVTAINAGKTGHPRFGLAAEDNNI